MSSWASYLLNSVSPEPNQCLITDMDECLIHSFDDLTEEQYRTVIAKDKTIREHIFRIELDIRTPPIYGVKRPGLSQFLEYSLERFTHVVLWSAGKRQYVNHITEEIFKDTGHMPLFILSREFCTPEDINIKENKKNRTITVYRKPLSKLKSKHSDLTLESCFFLDDNPDTSVHNVENHILIPRFDPEPTPEAIKSALKDDKALFELMKWFEKPEVKQSTDIRKLDMSKIFT